MKEVYERVQPEELKSGDKVFCEYYQKFVTLKTHNEGDPPWLWTVNDDEVFGWENLPIFRQLPPERNPDVLERAMMMMEIAWGNGLKYERTGLCYIDKAIRELESEAGR